MSYRSNAAAFEERMNERTRPCRPTKGSVFVLKNDKLVMFQPSVDIVYRWGHPYWKQYNVALIKLGPTKFQMPGV